MEAGMLRVSDALTAVLREAAAFRGAGVGAAEQVSLASAAGRVLASDARAPWNVPRVPTSIKDGYAVQSALVNSRAGSAFRLANKAFAGQSRAPGGAGGAYDVVYVTTGSPLPAGFDAVVEEEQSEVVGAKAVGAEVRFKLTALSGGRVSAGQDVRAVGSDVAEGQLLVRGGTVLDAAALGLLAMVGWATVAVEPRPRVAVLSTGDELLDASQAGSAEGAARLASGAAVLDANRPMLLALAADPAHGGSVVTDLGVERDHDRARLDAAGAPDEDGDGDGWLRRAVEGGAQVIITSGGVSAGERDFVRGALERRGHVLVERLWMKPGKPMLFALVSAAAWPGAAADAAVAAAQPPRRALVFALPGNPVSGVVTFHLLVAPALRLLAGWRESVRPPRLERVVLAREIKLDPSRPEFHRARLSQRANDGALLADSTGFQRSSALPSMSRADALLELPDAGSAGRAALPAGTEVVAWLVGDLRAQSLLCPPLAPAQAPAQAPPQTPAQTAAQTQTQPPGPRLWLATLRAAGDVRTTPVERLLGASGLSFSCAANLASAQAAAEYLRRFLDSREAGPELLVIDAGDEVLAGAALSRAVHAATAGAASPARRVPGLEELLRAAPADPCSASDDVVLQAPGRVAVVLLDRADAKLAVCWRTLVAAALAATG